MALTWDITRCADREKLDPHVTEALVFMSMVVGWGWELNNSTIQKAWERLSFYEKLNGAILSIRHEDETYPRPFTLDDLKAYIGLRTNVAPITDAAFLRNIYRVHCERHRITKPAKRALRSALASATDEVL